MDNTSQVEAVDHRVDDTNKRLGQVADEVRRLGEIIRGNGDGIGMRADVETLLVFMKEIKNYVRVAVVLVMGEAIAVIAGVIIWVLIQMNK